MEKKNNLEPQFEDYVKYVKNNIDYCDDFTIGFVHNLEQKWKKQNFISPKQYYLLKSKVKEIFIEKNLDSFHSNILTDL